MRVFMQSGEVGIEERRVCNLIFSNKPLTYGWSLIDVCIQCIGNCGLALPVQMFVTEKLCDIMPGKYPEVNFYQLLDSRFTLLWTKGEPSLRLTDVA